MAFWGDIGAQILKVLEEGAAAATAKSQTSRISLTYSRSRKKAVTRESFTKKRVM